MDSSHHFPIIDALDHDILLHRNIHFGGSFDVMIDYYRKNGKGVQDEFPFSRLEFLRDFERKGHCDLTENILTEYERDLAEKIKQKYFSLRDIYEGKEKNPIARLVADLVLSEKQNPASEINALIQQGSKAVGPLIELISSFEFYDPLYPGYGYAPLYAIHCLGLIGDKRAILPLFHLLGKHPFTIEEATIEALTSIGDEAKTFLLKVLHHQPISKDNELAIVALLNFPEEALISSHCLNLLKAIDPKKNIALANYLIFGCIALTDPTEREAFKVLSQNPAFPEELRKEMNLAIKGWE
jgi:hypothetical protein